jgi:DNA-binding beta-propeller fold protein YncE
LRIRVRWSPGTSKETRNGPSPIGAPVCGSSIPSFHTWRGPSPASVQVYDRSGNQLRVWGSRGQGPGQFDFEDNPHPADRAIPFSGKQGIDNGEFWRIADIAVGPNGTVYVLEDRPTRLGRAQEFDASGTFVTTFGRSQIQDSGGIVVDALGDVLVADDFGDDIKVFGPAGKLLRTIGQAGEQPGQLNFPTDLALDGNTLYVADQDNLRVVRFDLAAGQPTGSWPTTATAVGLATDAAGDV